MSPRADVGTARPFGIFSVIIFFFGALGKQVEKSNERERIVSVHRAALALAMAALVSSEEEIQVSKSWLKKEF